MRLSWKLGRVAGIDLFLHPSALIIFLLASNAAVGPLRSIAFVVALLTSIVLHELGHALMARRYGIETADITLYLFGGVARLQRMPRSAGPEMLIALAGPAVNVAIAIGLAGALALTSLVGSSPWLLFDLLYMNAALALFNLLPIFPMDGGRVLRALLSGWIGRARATEIAATFGRAVAVIAGVYFLASGEWQLALLAGFVYLAAGMERMQVRGEAGPAGGPSGLVEVPTAPAGFRWVDRGDGVWRLVPISLPVFPGGRSWG